MKISTLVVLFASVLGLHYTLDAINVWYASPELSVQFNIRPPEYMVSYEFRIPFETHNLKVEHPDYPVNQMFYPTPPEVDPACPVIDDIIHHRPDRNNPVPHGTFWFPGPKFTL